MSTRKINNRWEWLLPVGALLLLAAILRLFSLSREPLLNADGIAYILQAKAFYLQQAEQLLETYPYPTNLAPMIAGLFHFTGDWIFSAQLISIFFSLLTIIPFYFLNRIFWSRRTATMVVFLYVVSPVFTELAHEVIRGPQFWFFLVLGLWGICDFLEREKPPAYLLILVAGAFIMAAWSRIEGLIPLFITAVWLVSDSRSRKIRYLSAYFLPCGLILLVAAGLMISHNQAQFAPLGILFHGVNDRLLASVNRFQWLRDGLVDLRRNPPPGTGPGFFAESRTLLWFLAVGATANSLRKTFGVIFFLITLFGLLRIRADKSGTNQQRRAKLFLKLLLLGGIFFIYIQILLNWSSSERFIAQIYFPALVFAGYGFERLFIYGQKIKPDLSRTRAALLGCLVLLLCSLFPIVERSNLSRAVVFKDIGQMLATRHPAGQEIKLCGTSDKILFTHFYANLNRPTVASPRKYCDIIRVDELKLSMLGDGQYDYLLLSDRDGGRRHFLSMMEQRADAGIVVVTERMTEKFGKVALFSLRSKSRSEP
ncbi:MAG: glycosyltransferase family 39 protein [Deltaproteobacteria bacterium]|nr:glycosyltransferase family 39 protein [Deltaproteobacteria bacterium]